MVVAVTKSAAGIAIHGLPLLVALVVASCAEVRPPPRAPAGQNSRAPLSPQAIAGCQYLRVYVDSTSSRAYAVAVEYGLMTRRKATRAEKLSRQLAESFARSLSQRGFELVDSPERSYWIVRTQAEPSGGDGRFIASLSMRRMDSSEPDHGSRALDAAQDASAHGLNALIDSHRLELARAAGEVADRAALLFFPQAMGLCRHQREALEAEEIRTIRKALLEEMKAVREGQRKQLDVTAEKDADRGEEDQ